VADAEVMETARVMGRRAEGAAIGATVGAVLISALILGPAAVRLDAYEISDPLVYMGLPLLALATAAGTFTGAILGTARRSSQAGASTVKPLVPPTVLVLASAAVVVGWALVLGLTTGLLTPVG